jgi:hypothetical protein
MPAEVTLPAGAPVTTPAAPAVQPVAPETPAAPAVEVNNWAARLKALEESNARLHAKAEAAEVKSSAAIEAAKAEVALAKELVAKAEAAAKLTTAVAALRARGVNVELAEALASKVAAHQKPEEEAERLAALSRTSVPQAAVAPTAQASSKTGDARKDWLSGLAALEPRK